MCGWCAASLAATGRSIFALYKSSFFNKHFLCAKLSIVRVSGSERKTERERNYLLTLYLYIIEKFTLHIFCWSKLWTSWEGPIVRALNIGKVVKT